MEDPKFTIARIVIDGASRQITAECALEHPEHSMKQAIIKLPTRTRSPRAGSTSSSTSIRRCLR